jgi:AmmeMemoRadiSam system protein B
MSSLPRLRALDLVPVQVGGRPVVAVHDPEGLVEDTLVLPLEVAEVALLLDGKRDWVDVQVEYARRHRGALLFRSDLMRIVDELDRCGLLETEEARRRRAALEEAFRRAPERPPYFAGRSYPSDPDRLWAQLARSLRAVDPARLPSAAPRGVVAPHVDFERGGPCYGWAYSALARSEATAFLLLGVAHAGAAQPLVLCTKPYRTPLGTLPVDQEWVEDLLRELPDFAEAEAVHRTEHSLEFQAVFLQVALAGRPAAVVPVLCSAFELWTGGRSPREVELVERGIRALRRTFRDRADRAAVVVGVDFSHVGPRFGDPEPPDSALALRTSVGDHRALDHVLRGDPEGFWHEVAARGNPQRIDATSALYTALRVLEPVRGELLHYAQAPDPAGGIVSFASVALY